MKLFLKIKGILVITLCTLALVASSTELSKTVTRNFKVSPSTELNIINSFGKVHVNNWDKNEIDIEVVITVESPSDSRAQRILDDINIEIKEGPSSISVSTLLDNINTRSQESMEVNYTINMPAGNPLDLDNRFGDVYLDDRGGAANIEVSYGALKAGNFDARSYIEVSFGSGDIGHFSEGDIEIKYSDVDILGAGIVDLRQQFSDVEMGAVREIDLDSRYGSMRIEKVGDIDADVQFTDFSIDELTGSIIMKCKYVSDFEIDLLRKTFTRVDIDGDFGSYEINLEEGLQASIDGQFRFADLRNSGVDVDFHYRVKDNNSVDYRGKIGGGHADKQIIIRSSYGDLRLSQR